MVKTGSGKQRCIRTLLFILFALNLLCLAAPETAASGAYPAWVRQYSGGGDSSFDCYYNRIALAVDAQGNVYVTGTSKGAETGRDFLTIKYNSAGRQLWARRYNGPGNADDQAAAMSVDSKGNVYVTGKSLQSDTFSDYVTIKYSTDGQRLWVRRYNGPGNGEDIPRAMDLDSQGNVYVTGWSAGSYGCDYATIKYHPEGQRLWVRRYNGLEGLGGFATAIAVDPQDNVYVTGLSIWSYFQDFATIKYGPDGQQLWVARDDAPGDHPTPCAIAVDAQGNVSITGGNRGGCLTIKYNPEGQRLWAQRDNMGNEGEPKGLAVDDQGHVYVSGWVLERDPKSPSWSEYRTIKYGPDGQMIWGSGYGHPSGGARAIALDGQGNIYVTGSSNNGIATIKSSPEGGLIWENRRQVGEYLGRYMALAVDNHGNVYVTGYSKRSGTGYDLVTIKYVQTPRTGK